MRLSLLVSGLVAGMIAVPALAQDAQPAQPDTPPEVAKLRDFVKSPEYVSQLVRIVMSGEKDIPSGCAEPKPMDRAGFQVLNPPTFKDGQAQPVAGSWRDRLKIDRCGKPVVHNILFVARDGGQPALGLLLPGETGAVPAMQKAILQQAGPVAMAKAKCSDPKTVIVANTEHDAKNGQPKIDAQGHLQASEWQENWSFYACGKEVSVPVLFKTDGNKSLGFKVPGSDVAQKSEKKK